MSEILFLNDPHEMCHARAHLREVFERCRVVTGDLATIAEAERLGIRTMNEWDYLKSEDVEENFEEAGRLVHGWWGNDRDATRHEGICLAEMASYELAWPFEMCLNSRTIYNRILDALKPRRIHLFEHSKVGVCRTGPVPIHPAAVSVSQAVLRWLSEQRGVEIESHPSPPKLSQRQRSRQIPGPTPNPLRRTRAAEGRVADHVLLLLDNGLRPKEAQSLEEIFSRAEGWQVVRLSQFAREAITGWNWGDDVLQRLQCLWAGFVAVRGDYKGPHPEIFSNYHLEFQFRRIWDEMILAARLCGPFIALLETIRPEIIVLGHDSFTVERTLVGCARRCRIPTAALLHGGLCSRNGYRFLVGDADRFLVWNETDCTALEGYGVPKEKLCKVGSLIYDERYRRLEAAHDVSDPHRPPSKRTATPIIVFLTAAINSGMAAPQANPGNHHRTWQCLVACARRHPEWTFVIKPHPAYDNYDFYRHLCRFGPANLRLKEALKLADALACADVAVLVNYCTTAALEAMLVQVPVVFLQTAIYGAPSRADNVGGRGMIVARSVEELERVIGELLENSPAQADLRDEVNALLTDLLGPREYKASERYLRAISEGLGDHPARNPLPCNRDDVLFAFQRLIRTLILDSHHEARDTLEPLLGALSRQESPCRNDAVKMMYVLSVVIGLTAEDGRALRGSLRSLLYPLANNQRAADNDLRLAWQTTYRTALTRHRDSGLGPSPLGLAPYALFEMPRHTLLDRSFQSLFFRGVFGQILRWASWRKRTNVPAVWRKAPFHRNAMGGSFSE